MEVWTLNKNCLITLYNNWVNYYNSCIDALNDITHWTHVSFETDYQLKKSWAAEAEYRRRCSDLINWKNKWHNELNLKHNKFLQFYINTISYNSNILSKITYFQRFKITITHRMRNNYNFIFMPNPNNSECCSKCI